MGIKQKTGPLQPKNINILSSNKSSILDTKLGYATKSHKVIDSLHERINAIFEQNQDILWDRLDSSHMMTQPDPIQDSVQDHNFVIDFNDDDDDDVNNNDDTNNVNPTKSITNNINSFDFLRNFNSISFMSELLQDDYVANGGYTDTVDAHKSSLWCEDKYVTKFPQYSKKSIDYSLSILQEKSIENDEKIGSPDSISTPLNVASHTHYCSDDLEMVMDIFNSSQISQFPLILPPPMVEDNGEEMMETDESLSEFYRSYSYIPERHYIIHRPLQIIQPMPTHSTFDKRPMITYQPASYSMPRDCPPIQFQDFDVTTSTDSQPHTSNLSIQSDYLVDLSNNNIDMDMGNFQL